MKRRRRRIVYNDDCDNITYPGSETPAGFLSQRLWWIRKTQVDSVSVCGGNTTIVFHRSKVAENYARFTYGGIHDTVREAHCSASELCQRRVASIRGLAGARTDPLELPLKFCRRNGLEALYSFRVNDVHDSFHPWQLSHWKRTRPEAMMETPESANGRNEHSPRWWWSALNFERPEVRRRLHTILRDVCHRYPVDGLELDFFRSPMLFSPNLDFQSATGDQVRLLTGFVRRLRRMLYELGTRNHRPLLLAARVPATPDLSRHVGIDLERWLREDLIDLLRVGGGMLPFTERVGETIKLAHRHGVPAHVTLAERHLRTTGEFRAAAANAWADGADGIYTFNIFPNRAPDQRFRELGSAKALRRLDKAFVLRPMVSIGGPFDQAVDANQVLPLAIPGVARLPIGDDVRAAARAGQLARSAIVVKLNHPSESGLLRLGFNGATVAPVGAGVSESVEFVPDPGLYRVGDNQLSLGSQGPAPPGLAALEIQAQIAYLK